LSEARHLIGSTAKKYRPPDPRLGPSTQNTVIIFYDEYWTTHSARVFLELWRQFVVYVTTKKKNAS